MNTLSQIYNESYGYQVATNSEFVAISNPTTRFYDPCSGEGIVGEVYLVRKNKFNNNYENIKVYRQKPASYWGFLYSYINESGSAGLAGITSSLNYESSSLDSELTTCSFLTLEDATSQILLSEFGKSVDISDYDLAIADTNYSESFFGNFSYNINNAVVNIYEIADRSASLTCLSESKYNFTQSDIPRCVITGSINDEFGTSVSITNNYLAIGAPNYTNGSGSVYIYKYDATCGYALLTQLSSSSQTRFGYSISLDKKYEDKLIIGTDNLSDNSVYIYTRDADDNWEVLQTLTHNTSSNLLRIDGQNFDFYPISQSNDKYGYSVDIYDHIAVVGAPTDLIYYDYSGSLKVRERGSAYIYVNNAGCNISSSEYVLLEKTYGDALTFKDNLFGYSVSTYKDKILIGSPKPYFPFSSAYLSASVYRYNKDFNENDFGQSTYNGQVLLYEYFSGSSKISQITSAPISYRKKSGESYSAYGHSVDISSENIVVGSPILLNDDRYLETPYLVEDSGSGPTTCSLNSVDVLQILVEDDLTECNNCSTTQVVLTMDQPIVNEIEGKSFIYDFDDLQTDYIVGNTFYNNNRIVINNSGSIIGDFLNDPIDPDEIYLNMNYKSQLTLNEQQYICTIEPGEFNISTNKTATVKDVYPYEISNEYEFDFKTLDLILRYLNSKITTNQSEYWWNTFIEGEIEESIHEYYTNMIYNYTDNILTEELKCILAKKDFDVNGDGRIDILDGNLIWKYFVDRLSINNYKEYLTIGSKRNNYDDLIKFLDTQTGKLNKEMVNPEFFNYSFSSSLDITGSYLAPYITTVGLYSGTDLVAVAKLAHPIKNTGEIPINIVVKWYN